MGNLEGLNGRAGARGVEDEWARIEGYHTIAPRRVDRGNAPKETPR
jgi:hypothetical protein